MKTYLAEFLDDIKHIIELDIQGSANKDITADKRYYYQETDNRGIFVKNHENTEGEYREIPRLLHRPGLGDDNDKA